MLDFMVLTYYAVCFKYFYIYFNVFFVFFFYLIELDTINEYYLDIKNKLLYINKLRENTLNKDEYYLSVNAHIISISSPSTKTNYKLNNLIMNGYNTWLHYIKPPKGISLDPITSKLNVMYIK